jgi:RepB DNA-primase from phage plasmid
MATDAADNGQKEAQAMFEAFASVGATQFDLTITARSGTKETFRRGVKLADLFRALPSMLDSAKSKRRNVIVRPHGPGVSFIQLDDLKADMLARLAPAVFLTLQTSPGNFQAWIATAGAEDKDFSRRLRKGTGADATASGATRVAGSFNFKEKYAPNFARVTVAHVNPGHRTTSAELERLGLAAAPEPTTRQFLPPARPRPRASARKWPDYERCLQGAPPSQSRPGQTRDSIGDFTWCVIALDWGFSAEATAARLMEESRKAQANGETYAARTLANAAAAVARRGPTQRPNRVQTPKQG